MGVFYLARFKVLEEKKQNLLLRISDAENTNRLISYSENESAAAGLVYTHDCIKKAKSMLSS